jgi:hypothetical protein
MIGCVIIGSGSYVSGTCRDRAGCLIRRASRHRDRMREERPHFLTTVLGLVTCLSCSSPSESLPELGIGTSGLGGVSASGGSGGRASQGRSSQPRQRRTGITRRSSQPRQRRSVRRQRRSVRRQRRSVRRQRRSVPMRSGPIARRRCGLECRGREQRWLGYCRHRWTRSGIELEPGLQQRRVRRQLRVPIL